MWNGEKLPEIVTTLKSHSGMVKGVVFDPVGRYLASQSDDKTLRVWRLSDWKEEVCVSKPFADCGATTHVLRPGWSPDGSMLVSAHAMNEGGPTAQIVERETWKTQKDFVGHKKAVACIRFNSNILHKKKDESETHVMIALGSRDRSFSVWSTNLRRPLFVVTDAFDQSVLDLSWSRDGKVLLACSMDGSVAAVILKSSEVGQPLSDEKKNDYLVNKYGKSVGLPTFKSRKKTHETNGTSGPVVVENPDLLIKPSAASPSNSKSAPEKKKQPRGPTDKQIEARTSDGKRRITPMFILPDDASQGFGSGEFQSTSTKEASNIAVEKRDGIVEPNVSPSGKGRSKPTSAATSNSNSNAATPSKSSTPKSKEDKNSKEKKAQAEDSDDGVNVIQVRKKPRRIIASDDDDSDEEEKKKSDGDQSDGKPAKKEEDETPAKFKELSMSKPNLVAKRKAEGREDELPKAKKRGRPALNKSRDDESATMDAVFSRPPEEPVPNVVTGPIVVRSSSEAMNLNAVLPPLLISRPRNVSFSPASAGGAKASVQIINNYKKVGESALVHLVKFIRPHHPETPDSEGKRIIQILLPSPVNSLSIACNSELVAATCLNASLHMFSPDGKRLFPPIMLPSPVANITVSGDLLAAVTTAGKFFLWKLRKERGFRPEMIVRNECILSLLERGIESESESEKKEPVVVSKLSLDVIGEVSLDKKPVPVLTTSVGRSYVLDDTVGTWLMLADADSSVSAASSWPNPALSLRQLQSATGKRCSSLPLASLSLGTPSFVAPVANEDLELRGLADASHCEAQMAAAEYLNSPEEYRHWLVALATKLTECGGENSETRLRDLLESLMRDEEGEKLLGSLAKKDLLKDVLAAVGRGGVAFQRLYAEYQERLTVKEKTNDGSDDLDDILHEGTDFAMNDEEEKKDEVPMETKEEDKKEETTAMET